MAMSFQGHLVQLDRRLTNIHASVIFEGRDCAHTDKILIFFNRLFLLGGSNPPDRGAVDGMGCLANPLFTC
jgi:hypothetical protein